MAVALCPMDPRRLPTWLEHSRDEYAKDFVAVGQTLEDAYRHADESLASSFPSGTPRPRHTVFDVLDETGANVGYLWIGPDTSDNPDAWWIWDITIDEDKRGQGFGRKAMLLGEEYARSQGAQTLGLSVFGFNTGAQHLYKSLGYETTSIKMSKKLN
ncbi:GNAT family N-acetyltransferase [Nocardia sp. CA-128927]|uniref:GNAT family N-acetyltransferase n=1 Tax=Nocardia sp. CA-128927 TaxID=3239975 RepID=UPI003D963668